MYNDLFSHLKKTALDNGALAVGVTRIRKIEPVIVFGFPFSEKWFLKYPLAITKRLEKQYLTSKNVHDLTTKILKSEGFTAHCKTVLSVYGDFRPLAVSAGLGEWGRNGLIVNHAFGTGLLFSAVFTNAPLDVKPQEYTENKHCNGCGECIASCPSKAFENGRFYSHRCALNVIKGCAECIKVCRKNSSNLMG